MITRVDVEIDIPLKCRLGFYFLLQCFYLQMLIE